MNKINVASLCARFDSSSVAELRLMVQALEGIDYLLLGDVRVQAEAQAYAHGRELPARSEVLNRAAHVPGLSAQERVLAELALHYALIGAAARDLISPAHYAVLLTPVAIAWRDEVEV